MEFHQRAFYHSRILAIFALLALVSCSHGPRSCEGVAPKPATIGDLSDEKILASSEFVVRLCGDMDCNEKVITGQTNKSKATISRKIYNKDSINAELTPENYLQIWKKLARASIGPEGGANLNCASSFDVQMISGVVKLNRRFCRRQGVSSSLVSQVVWEIDFQLSKNQSLTQPKKPKSVSELNIDQI